MPSRRVLLLAGVVVALAALGSGLARAGVFSSPRASRGLPPITLEKIGAAQAMAGPFARASTGPIPSAVSAEVGNLNRTAPPGTPDLPGKVLLSHGRLLLSGLGPDHRSIYVFPNASGGVCFAITGLAAGCKPAFPVGQPATIDGGSLYFPSTSGPPGELSGLTKDDVARVQVVVNGTPKEAVMGHDAWYYVFPNNQIPATAATELIVTLKNGSTTTLPTGIVAPPTTSKSP